MNIVIDTDIISCIAKIKKFDLLELLFRQTSFILPNRVYDEIMRAKEQGYEFVNYIISLIDKKKIIIPSLEKSEIHTITKMEQQERALGFGEIEAIVLATRKDSILLTNDEKVEKRCKLILNHLTCFSILYSYLAMYLVSHKTHKRHIAHSRWSIQSYL